jgi:hypothetical protein
MPSHSVHQAAHCQTGHCEQRTSGILTPGGRANVEPTESVHKATLLPRQICDGFNLLDGDFKSEVQQPLQWMEVEG